MYDIISKFLFYFTELHDNLDDKKNVVEFDFLGKDSIRYVNQVPVEKPVGKLDHFFERIVYCYHSLKHFH